MIAIRREKPEDIAPIRHLLELAFGGSNEADLVDALRQRGVFTLSVVAIQDNQVVGHILFPPVTIEPAPWSIRAIALGPLAVLPMYQRRGIGSQLVRIGLGECRQAGHEIVVVLGYPDFYTRFGFSPAKQRVIRYEHDVPDDVFMVMELNNGALAGLSGVVKYEPEFTSV